MPAAETARLIASLDMNARGFNQGVASSLRGLGKLEGRLGNLGAHARRGVQNAAGNLLKIGAVASAALGTQIAAGIDSLATLEDATTAVDGAIKAVGKTGQVTSGQIAGWANEIEAATQAAFDDKDITRNAATLIRYGRVTTSNLKPALTVMTDLAAKTGSVDSAATLLAKALADPTKAAGKLSKAGVVLTKGQQEQIKALVKAGKVGKAQKLILDALTTSTKGAAAASAGPFRDMQNQLGDTIEDAQRLVAEGSFPVLQRLGERVRAALADPKTMDDIRNLGRGAADFLDSAIEFAGRIPWDSIKEALRIGGTGAKAILDAFTNMPPWVQTAVISGWGLNKLTGGALGDIVGELGKGLIKGVLGMTAGVVNLKAGVVNGGGVPGAGGGSSASGGMGLLGFAGTAALGTAVGLGVTEGLRGVQDLIADKLVGNNQQGRNALANANNIAGGSGPLAPFQALLDLPGRLDKVLHPDKERSTFTPLDRRNPGEIIATALATSAPMGVMTDRMADFLASEKETTGAVQDVKAQQARAAVAMGTAISSSDRSNRSGQAGITAATNAGASRIVGAIASNRPIVNVQNETKVNVTASGVQTATTTSKSYGEQNGSAGGGGGHAGGGNIAG